MYTILICNDNTLMATKRERIMQRSKLVDTLQFLVPQIYNGLDMSDCTVQLEYVLPCSKKYCTELLDLSEEMYKDHLKYLLPFDTKITSEPGEVQIQLTFVKTELDEKGNGIQKVRKTSPTTIDIIPISAWSDIIPDSALSAIDERLIKLDAQMRGMNELTNALDSNKVDNLVYDEKSDSLHLMAGNKVVGDKVSVKEIMDDGIPVVDLDSNGDSSSNTKPEDDCDCGCEHEDNVVEFGDSDIVEKLEDDNVVEF